MFNPQRLLGQLLQSGLSGGLGRGRRRNRGGGLLGGFSSGTKAQIGMGLVGIAIAAYEHYSKQNQTAVSEPHPPSPSSSPESRTAVAGPLTSSAGAPADGQRDTDATLLVQAMVAAAAADGVIDDAERAAMLRRASDAGFDDETKAFLEQELKHPKSLAVIVASARPELATDLYAASCAAITADTAAERIYLDTLGTLLNLTADARAEIQRQLDLA